MLPPTLVAAKFHLLRVYLQVQQWLSNVLLVLLPIKCNNQPIPSDILLFINIRKTVTELVVAKEPVYYARLFAGPV